MTPLQNQGSDFFLEEVGRPDFLLGPTTSKHKLSHSEARMKQRLPQTSASLFSCRCTLPCNHLDKTNSFPFCFSETGLKTIVSPVKKSCLTLYNIQKRYEEMSKVATA